MSSLSPLRFRGWGGAAAPRSLVAFALTCRIRRCEHVLLHDRQLTATEAFVGGQEYTISYRYKHGKIEPADTRPVTDKSGPTLK